MRHLFLLFCGLSWAIFGYGQGIAPNFTPDFKGAVNPWTKTPFAHRDSSFQFAIISDLAGGYREANIFPEAVKKINRMVPEFVMSVGDLIEGYTKDTAQILRWWHQFDGWVGQLESPFFYVPGNHDLTNKVMTRIWEQRYGRAYYHFVYRDVLFLVLSSEDGAPAELGETGNMSPAQVAYFQQVLAQHKEVKWTLLFMHRPLWFPKEPGMEPLEALLQDRNYTVFAGHAETYVKEQRFGRDYYVLASTGSGSDLSGDVYGEFDQIAWVTMGPKGPRVANLNLTGILDTNVRTTASLPFSNAMKNSSVVRHVPILEENKEINTFNTALLFKNQLAAPLHIEGQFFQHPVFRMSETRLDTVLQAGQSLRWPVRLNMSPGQRASEQAPVVFQWKMEAQGAGKLFERHGAHPITVQPVRRCLPAPKQLVLDGRWQEWGKAEALLPDHLEYYLKTWHGPADMSYDVRVARDDKFLYLALRVQDDSLLYTPFRHSWEQEGAEMTLVLSDSVQIRVSFSATNDAQHPMVDIQENWPAQAILAADRRLDGFSAEIAIPVEALQKLYGKPLQQFQLQWVIYDHDGMEDQYKGTKAFWMPEYQGAGVFRVF